MRKADPAVAVIQFFETAPIDVAKTIFAICKGTLQRRLPKVAKPRVVKPREVRETAVS
jgi:hypothetical protein